MWVYHLWQYARRRPGTRISPKPSKLKYAILVITRTVMLQVIARFKNFFCVVPTPSLNCFKGHITASLWPLPGKKIRIWLQLKKNSDRLCVCNAVYIFFSFFMKLPKILSDELKIQKTRSWKIWWKLACNTSLLVPAPVDSPNSGHQIWQKWKLKILTDF